MASIAIWDFFVFLNGEFFFLPRDDLVYTELRKPETEMKPLKLDEDLPGMGQFYCLHCEYV